MSKDIIVLTPNGRRQKVHCTPDTSILQVLEDVCHKQGFQASEYDLKHHNKVLDLTTTIRFSNLPNKACLEMVEVERKREESIVTIALTLEDGDRRTGNFSPNTHLYDVASELAMNELRALCNPTILFMRQEVIGIAAMKDKTLRQLGLLKGRAILRLLNKADEPMQANVSTVYKAPKVNDETNINRCTNVSKPNTNDNPTTSQIIKDKTNNEVKFNPVEAIKRVKATHETTTENNIEPKTETSPAKNIEIEPEIIEVEAMDIDAAESKSHVVRDNLERRLKIEEEVTFLGAQKAIAFMQPEEGQEEIEDLPDDFYDLTVEEVRRLYVDLQEQRIKMENTPLTTSSQREQNQQTTKQKLNVYKHAVVRIQFPDNIILQGVFSPTNKIQDIIDFIKEHIKYPEKPFDIFTTPFKESLDPQMTLLDARFVPCVHMHFKWQTNDADEAYLKEDIYSRKTSCDAASILASKYRAPNRQKIDVVSSENKKPSTSKVPKWFKN